MAGPYIMQPRLVGGVYVMCTGPFTTGGGATSYSLQPCNLPSSGNVVFSDYFVVKDDNGYLWPVAKPPELRCSLTGAIIEGVTISYSYNGTAALLWSRRTASYTGGTLIEGITPPYIPFSASPAQAGSTIYADMPTNGTGVVIATGDTTTYGNPPTAMSAGAAVVLMDTNRSGRAWSVLANQTGEGS